MKLVTCRKCGEGHQCEGTLSSAERSAKAIGTRWSKAREGSELAKKAGRLRAEKPRVAPIVQPEIARSPRVPFEGLAGYVEREHPAAEAGAKSIRKDFAETARAFDYKCSMHRKDTKGCQYCALEHGRAE